MRTTRPSLVRSPTSPGWLRVENCLKLYELAYHAAGRILEIGTFHGKSTTIIAKALACARRNTLFASLDVNPEALEAASRTLTSRGLGDHVLLIRGTAHAFARATSGFEPAFVFVDGDYSLAGVRADVAALADVVPPGGLVLFHDFVDPRNDDRTIAEYGVPQAVRGS